MSLISRKKNPALPLVVSLLALAIATQAHSDSPTAGIGSFGQGNGYSVSGNMGAAGFPISIDAPEGHHGLTPRITLGYNSQAKVNGPYGFGWGIGIGTIIRSGPKGSFDEVAAGLTDNISWNRYSLDLFGSGGELVLVNSQTREFRTRNETFFKIQADSTFERWQVWDKAGVSYDFEQVPDWDNGNILYLTKVKSPTGGWIEVDYKRTGNPISGTEGMILPLRIRYGSPACGSTGVIGGDLTASQDGGLLIDSTSTSITTDTAISGNGSFGLTDSTSTTTTTQRSGDGLVTSSTGSFSDPSPSGASDGTLSTTLSPYTAAPSDTTVRSGDLIATTTSTTCPYYVIEFQWTNRTDTVLTSMAGRLYSTGDILDGIWVGISSGSRIRRYKITYETSFDSGRLLVKSVELFGKDDTSQGQVIQFGYSTNQGKTTPWRPARYYNDDTFEDFVDNGGDRGSFLIDLNRDALPDQLYGYEHQKLDGTKTYTGGYKLNESPFGPLHEYDVSFGPVKKGFGGDRWFTKRIDCEGCDPRRNDDCSDEGIACFINSGHHTISSQAQFGEVDGDGRIDIVRRQATTITEDFEYQDLYYDVVLEFNGVTDYAGKWGVGEGGVPLWMSVSKDLYTRTKGVVVMDANGDGLADYLQGVRIANGDDPGTTDTKRALLRRYLWTSSNQGDLSDAYAESSSYAPPTVFYEWNGNEEKRGFEQGLYDRGVRFADLNGDGLVDIMSGQSGYTERIGTNMNYPPLFGGEGLWFNTGTGWGGNFQSKTTWVEPDGSTEEGKGPAFVYVQDIVSGGNKVVGYASDPEGWEFVDINGDGLMDLVITVVAQDETVISHTYLNRGGLRWESRDEWQVPTQLGNFGTKDSPYRFADINGDGLTDIVKANNATDDMIIFNELEIPDLMTSIRGPLGAVAEIAYKTNVKEGVESPGLVVVPERIRTRPNSSSEWLTTKYDFLDPVIGEQNWPRAREFRGYAKVLTYTHVGLGPQALAYEDPDRGTETWYETGEDLVGKPKMVRSWEVRPDRTTRVVGYFYDDLSDFEGRAPFFRPLKDVVTREFNPFTTSPTPWDDEPDRKNWSFYQYDLYGNVKKEGNCKDVGTNPYAEGCSEVVERTYAYNPGKWIMNNVVTESYKVHTKSSPSTWTEFYYDGLPLGQVDKGLLTKSIENGDQVPHPVETTYRYDSFGNRFEEKNEVTGEKISYTYDSLMRLFVVTSTTSLGATESFYYGVNLQDTAQPFGKLAKVTRPDGTVSQYTYDSLGRLKESVESHTTLPEIAKVRYEYEIFPTGGGRQRTLALESSSPEIWATSEDYFDEMGRVIRTTTQNEERELKIHSRKEYWTTGQLRKSCAPVEKFNPTGADFTVCTETSYDTVGRPTKVVSPLGTVTNSYVGKNVESRDEGGHLTITTYNGYGDPTRIVPPQDKPSTGYHPPGETVYAYDAPGRIGYVFLTSNGKPTQFTFDGFGRKLTSTDPHCAGVVEWTYDEAGNLETETDCRGKTIVHSYDALGRKTGTDIDGDGVMDQFFGYDSYPSDLPNSTPEPGEMTSPIGKPTWMMNSEGFTLWYYDGLGRSKREVKNLKGGIVGVSSLGIFQTRFNYDLLGRVTKVIYPSAREVSYQYNGQGLVEKVPGWVNSVDYNESGGATKVVYANDQQRRTDFDPATRRITRIRIERLDSITKAVTATDLDHGYTYYPTGVPMHGELQEISDVLDSKRTKTFQYDFLHRLTQETSTQGGDHSFAYNPNGTIKNRVDRGVTTTYWYHPDRPNAIDTLLNGSKFLKKYVYNANGDAETVTDLTNSAKQTFTYTPDRQVETVVSPAGSVGYSYDASRSLVRKSFIASNLTATIQLFVNPYLETITTVGKEARTREYILIGGKKIGVLEETTVAGNLKPVQNKYWQHMNHQGSVELVTKMASKGSRVVDRFYYSAYGETEVIHVAGDSKADYRFTGQRWEEAMGLYDYGPRMYDPKLGRFLQSDTIIPDIFDSQSLDPYAYARNNPIRYIDPTGHGFWETFGATMAGIVVGVAVTYVTGNPYAGAYAGFFTTTSILALNRGGPWYQVVGNATGVSIAWSGMGFGAGAMFGNPFGVVYGLMQDRDNTLGALAAAAVASALSYVAGDSFVNSEEAEGGVGGYACGPSGNGNCAGVDVKTSEQLPELDYHKLFKGDEVITSPYGSRHIDGELENHGGIDVAPKAPNNRYGTRLLAPTSGTVLKVNRAGGSIAFRPDGFSKSSALSFSHVKGLSNIKPGMHVQAGTPLGTLAKVGRTTGPHVHVQLHYGGMLYNPSQVMPGGSYTPDLSFQYQQILRDYRR